jgi:DNA invertase Pin-like site-specific DNA recombinase
MTNYFLYVRKSTDLEDRQVRSIEDQLSVLRALAKEQGFHVVREFTEKETAKKPGRPIFNDMMKRIESGEAHRKAPREAPSCGGKTSADVLGWQIIPFSTEI